MSIHDAKMHLKRSHPLLGAVLLGAVLLGALWPVAFGEWRLGASQVHAQSLSEAYVSISGSDVNTCATPQSPCRTIQAAIGKTAAGGAVHVGPGAYNENIQMKSGVSVIGAGPTNTSIVGAASVSGVVQFSNVTNALLQGFRITVATPIQGTDRGVNFTGSTDRTAILRNNIIQFTQYGIFIWTPSAPTIENNTLVGEPDEQGIYIGNSATTPLIRNNIITGYSIGIHVVAGTAAPTPIILYNDLWNNTENYRSYPNQTGTAGNISTDPAFVNTAARDFHLRNTSPSSPAIDAGDPSSPYNREPGPNGGRINMGAYGNTVEAATTPVDTKLITFETPTLGGDSSRVIDPYVDSATGVVFQREGNPGVNYVVGLVKNSGTSACVDPADANQKLGIGIDNGAVGFASTEVRATFPTLLNPPVTVSVLFQTGAGQPLRIRLFGATGNEVASNTETSGPANGTCGMPGDPRARTAVTVISAQPVAYAVIDMAAATVSRVFVLDDFRFASAGTHSISHVGLTPASPANLVFNQYVNLTFDYSTTWAPGVYIWARPMSGGALTPNYGAHASPRYSVGSGSGSGFFTISSGNAIVDSIRFEMWDPDQTQLLLETFIPVDYRFSNGCYQLTRAHSGAGSDPVATPAKSTYCVGDGQYLAGDAVNLSASPAAGWQVGSWSGTSNDASTAAANSLVMPARNHTASVAYVPICYALTLAHSGAGSDPVATPTGSSGCPAGRYRANESISVNAVAAPGWWIGGWIGASDDAATTPTNVLTMPAADHKVIVKYRSICYSLTLTHSGSGSDPAASPAQSATCPPGQYLAGDPIGLHAAPVVDWRVAGWSGVIETTNTSTDNSLFMPAQSHVVNVTYAQISSAVTGDAYEEDNLCTQARTINADGVSQEHSLHQAGDMDWVRFTAAANVPYRIEVNIPTGSLADVGLSVYDQCEGGPLDEFDAAFTPGARLDFTPATTTPVYVRLSNQDPQVGGANVTYQVAVRSLQAETAQTNRAMILVGGGLAAPDRLQSNINYVTEAVYAHFRANGLGAENIIFLTNDANIAMRTGPATVDALQSAITQWAKQRLTVGGTLTLYLMDHGESDIFYLNNANGHVLTPPQLDGWLDELETAIPEIKITVIIEACYSGSFIEGEQSISKDEPGRLVLTSTGAKLLAYASASGAYFSDFMLASLEQGYSMHSSFKATYAVVREMSNLRQEPQLDGNGNGIANESADIVLASRGVSGAGSEGWAPYIVSVQAPQTIENHSGALQAVVRDDKKVRRVWAIITPPSYQPPQTSAELVAETLPTLLLLEQGNDAFSALYTGFDEPGLYRIAVYAEDEDNLVTLPTFVEVTTGSRMLMPLVFR
ncbi:MAG: DUF1565 domain-containing protein [Anaerolineales bacterium]|nr:DUF1565 domain-containing protein [Anaerolineales bacterium]